MFQVWRDILGKKDKIFQSYSLFKRKLKSKLFHIEINCLNKSFKFKYFQVTGWDLVSRLIQICLIWKSDPKLSNS